VSGVRRLGAYRRCYPWRDLGVLLGSPGFRSGDLEDLAKVGVYRNSVRAGLAGSMLRSASGSVSAFSRARFGAVQLLRALAWRFARVGPGLVWLDKESGSLFV
jgi:hypothetical protein